MAKDTIEKALEIILGGTPAGIAKQGPKLKKLLEKYKKDKGKPKGRSPSMVLGSASKAGMQGKQGTGSLSIKRKPFQKTPNPGIPGRPPKSVFFRPKTTKKPGAKR